MTFPGPNTLSKQGRYHAAHLSGANTALQRIRNSRMEVGEIRTLGNELIPNPDRLPNCFTLMDSD